MACRNKLELKLFSFRLFLFAIVLALLLLCSLWKKRHVLFCSGWSTPSNRVPPSEGDSAGSCYAPPHYSRCSSFYHAPPPYSDVKSKPELYPLVFSYTDGSKNGNNGANYLMVQYFRNYIVRPIGSLSATSTVDSLTSSFICTANEANTMIPPPYSSAASPDGLSISLHNYAIPRSASQQACSNVTPKIPEDLHYLTGASSLHSRPMSVPNTNQNPMSSHHQFRASESANFADLFRQDEETGVLVHHNHQVPTSSNSTMTTMHTESSRSKNRNTMSDDDDDDFQPCSGHETFSLGNGASGINFEGANQSSSIYHSNDTMLSLSAAMMDKISYSRQTNDHTKLNMIQKQLEKCCEMIQQQQQQIQQTQSHFNVTTFDSESSIGGENAKKMSEMGLGYMNSNTASTVSSLANLNSPSSPPQATSPTQEVKDLLQQIHLLRDTNFSEEELDKDSNKVIESIQPGPSNEINHSHVSSMKRPTSLNSKRKFFNMKNRSVYLPIASNVITSSSGLCAKIRSPNSGPASVFMVKTRGIKGRSGWISKSAPSTPGTGFPSSFISDDSPLLNEQDEDAETDQNC